MYLTTIFYLRVADRLLGDYVSLGWLEYISFFYILLIVFDLNKLVVNHGMTSSANLDSSSAFLRSLLTGSNNAAWWQHASGLAGLTPNLFGSTLGTLGQTQDVASFQSLLKATGRSWCMNNTYLHLKLRDSQAESTDVGSVRSTLRWRQGRQGRQGRMKHCMILK